MLFYWLHGRWDSIDGDIIENDMSIAENDMSIIGSKEILRDPY